MIPMIQQVLYIDPQALPPKHRCRFCRRECYGPVCLRCQRDGL